MATSRSSEGWAAQLRAFSGRRDPHWPLDAEVARRLEALWEELEPLAATAPEPPPLGYRGVEVRDPSGRCWEAYRGAVTSAGERRADPDRAFERLILDTAPPSAVPAQVRELAGLT